MTCKFRGVRCGPEIVVSSPADFGDFLHSWLRAATERFDWLRTVSASAEVNRATRMFAKPSGNGWARARIALERAFAPCGTVQAIGDGKLPYYRLGPDPSAF